MNFSKIHTVRWYLFFHNRQFQKKIGTLLNQGTQLWPPQTLYDDRWRSGGHASCHNVFWLKSSYFFLWFWQLVFTLFPILYTFNVLLELRSHVSAFSGTSIFLTSLSADFRCSDSYEVFSVSPMWKAIVNSENLFCLLVIVSGRNSVDLRVRNRWRCEKHAAAARVS